MRKIMVQIMKKVFWNKIDEQETLERLDRKIETQKLENVTKIKEYGKRIESIKNESKIERERLRTEKINKLKK